MIEDDTRFGKGSCERYQLGNLRVDQAGVKGQSVRCQMFEAGPEIFMGQHALGRTAPGKGIEGSCGIEIRSEEHKSELQSLMRISYSVFRLKKKNNCLNTQ